LIFHCQEQGKFKEIAKVFPNRTTVDEALVAQLGLNTVTYFKKLKKNMTGRMIQQPNVQIFYLFFC
jgi:hypothetical protein